MNSEQSDDFDRDLARLESIRSTVHTSTGGTVGFLLSFIDKLWREYSKANREIDRLRLALVHTKGELCPVCSDTLHTGLDSLTFRDIDGHTQFVHTRCADKPHTHLWSGAGPDAWCVGCFAPRVPA
jgi:hypothetical protein